MEHPQDLLDYPYDAESVEELERLLLQGSMLTKAMKRSVILFPAPIADWDQPTILDLACGPADWLYEIANDLPQARLFGLDKSERLIAHNKTRRQHAITFVQGDVTAPLPFPDASFDLVNIRLVFSFLTPENWRTLVHECMRILKPGGALQLTEGERGFTNSAAASRLESWLASALQRAGATFSVDPTQWGIIQNLGPLLRAEGFERVSLQSSLSEYSYGQEAHEPTYQIYRAGLWYPAFQSLIERYCPEVTAEMWQITYQQMLGDFFNETFCGLFLFVTAVGWKSGQREEA